MVLHCMRFEPGNRSLTTPFIHRADITTKTGGSNIMPSSNCENCLRDSDAFLLTYWWFSSNSAFKSGSLTSQKHSTSGSSVCSHPYRWWCTFWLIYEQWISAFNIKCKCQNIPPKSCFRQISFQNTGYWFLKALFGLSGWCYACFDDWFLYEGGSSSVFLREEEDEKQLQLWSADVQDNSSQETANYL